MAQVNRWETIFDGAPITGDFQSSQARIVGSRRRSNAPVTTRQDIQGLRALAVVVVILDHLNIGVGGGFIGVDVFFVISGFLITGVLQRAAASRSIKSYFTHFYTRRARRILPASITVLAACWVTANLVFRGSRIAESHSDIRWALGFAANIHFAEIGTDYFQSTRPASIVQHFWSLAVEEQFYLVWPVLLITVYQIFKRYGASATGIALLTTSASATVGSFVWALRETHQNLTNAYFSTTVRAWELGVGATLALAQTVFPRTDLRLRLGRGLLVLIGTIVIVSCAFFMRPNGSFPAPAALIPVIATAAIIYAGSYSMPRHKIWQIALSNRVSQYLGDISYSLYLWHWPAIVVCLALFGSRSTLFYLTAITAMMALSIASFHFIEVPCRHKALDYDGVGEQRKILSRAAIAALALAVASLTLFVFKPAPAVPSFVASSTDDSSSSHKEVLPNFTARPTAALSHSIDLALEATEFPNLTPSLSKLSISTAQKDWEGCSTGVELLPTCKFASGTFNPSKVAVVLGDSISLSWLPTIRSALVPHGWTVYGLARQKCTAASVAEVGLTQSMTADCTKLHNAYPAILQALHPSLVFLSSVETTIDSIAHQAPGSVGALDDYKAGIVKTVRVVQAVGGRAIILSPPPVTASLSDCDSVAASPANCVSSITSTWHEQSSADLAAARSAGAKYIDTHLWFCSEQEYCPAFVGTTAIRYDTDHLTREYAEMLGNQLASQL